MSFTKRTDASLASSGLTRKDICVEDDHDGYWIDYLDLNGKPTGFRRKRMHDGPRRYYQPAGTTSHVYFPRGPKWRAIARDVSKRLRCTEGERKAAALTKHGLNCTAIGGKDAWRCEEWAQFKWKGRVVELIPDSDQNAKPHVRKSFLDLGDWLTSQGALVVYRDIHTLAGMKNTGADDFLVAKGKAAFKELQTHRHDSEYIKLWRESLQMIATLPELKLETVPAEWSNEKPPPVRFLIDHLLPAGIVSLITGPGGIGKTYFTLWLAMCVASGTRFLNLPVRQGRVVYLALEDPREVLRHRFHWLSKKHRFDAKSLQADLIIESLVGEQLHLLTMKNGVIQRSALLAPLIDQLKAAGPVLVVFDPMARLHGLNENDNAFGTAMINAAEHIAREVGCTVLLSHHVGKQNAGAKNGVKAYSARGGSAISDAARSIMNLSAVPAGKYKRFHITEAQAENNGVLLLRHEKLNYGTPYCETFFTRGQHGVLETFQPESAGAANPDWLKALRAWVKKRDDTTFTRRNVIDEFADISDVSKRTTEQLFDQAVLDGHVVSTGKKSKGGGALYTMPKGESK